jgi:DNA helicase HerA-like ATPase
VQHALRAFTPRDQKAVKTAAETLRPNPRLKAEQVITELGVGEALVSLLDENGRPAIVERAFVVPPMSQTGPIADAERQQLIRASALHTKYEKTVDRESAYEKLKVRTAEAIPEKPPAAGRPQQSIFEAATKSAARAIGSELGRQIMRGILGSILGSSTTTRRRRY